ncbi:alpha/beta hydrolase [Amycolatopsis sp. PS_44_ISF1]|uniref:alpha/beta hydrolase n=1 Tax=Amycolatopsis sp. PS_44_ISF1 TaxID=2974917 RepID=UPI0028DF831D|nr:alpha/beta hydrolase [Amycolatopsis sp. PS_44_ISF1]MDT8910829.1 alpha/beta hydrolase [Amycolatopsis sp. PS_44_ISF1]
MAIQPQVRVQAAAAQLLFWLPRPLRRLIAGPALRLDGQELALDAQLLLRLQKLNGGGLVSGSVARSRALLELGTQLVSGKRIEPVSTREVEIPVDGGALEATLYTPAGLPEPSGLLVFFHGGGWVVGSRATHDNASRYLAKNTGVRVLSVEYRLAPEHPFPVPAQDALAAFAHAHAQAGELGADPDRIAVGGDSAGGNLAAVVALATTRAGGPAPAFQLLIYPAVDFTTRRRSRELFGADLFLTDEGMKWFESHYVPEGTELTDPLLSPLLAPDHSGLPPAFIVTAGFDPLRDEGEAYAEKLRAAGVQVGLSRQADLIHGFLNFTGVGSRFREAVAEMTGALRLGLAETKKAPSTQPGR